MSKGEYLELVLGLNSLLGKSCSSSLGLIIYYDILCNLGHSLINLKSKTCYTEYNFQCLKKEGKNMCGIVFF